MLYVWLMVASIWAGMATASPLGLQPAPDWILEDEEVPQPARRITPKSVFVAPTFNECGPGYRHDPIAGRCVRIVKVNQKAQWDFFLSRLNAMYAQPTKQKVQSGPLHVALPLDPVTSTSTARIEPPTTLTTTLPSTTTNTQPPTTTDSTTIPTTTTNVPETTTSSTETVTSPTTAQPSTTNSQSTTTDQPSTTTDLPPSTSTISSTFPTTTPPTTYFTDQSVETTFPFSSTETSTLDYQATSTFSTFPTETTEAYTEFSTFPDPVTISSNHQHVTVKPKKCPPSVRQVGDYNSRDNLDCETETIRPHFVRFPSPTYTPRRKISYIRFPDRTWQASYWWPPQQNSWEQRQIPLPSSYQKIQHYPSWQRGRPTWSDTSLSI